MADDCKMFNNGKWNQKFIDIVKSFDEDFLVENFMFLLQETEKHGLIFTHYLDLVFLTINSKKKLEQIFMNGLMFCNPTSVKWWLEKFWFKLGEQETEKIISIVSTSRPEIKSMAYYWIPWIKSKRFKKS